MSTSYKPFLWIAVVSTTAFFLVDASELKVSYLKGKVEFADPELSGPNAISTVEINASVPPKMIIATAVGSRTEIIDTENQIIWRLGNLSAARWLNPNKCWVHSGSLLCSKNKDNRIIINTTKSNAIIEGPGTFIIEATSNGGFKFIPLESNGFIKTQKGGIKKVKGGRMILVLNDPSNFGDAYDIDLMLMLKSSRLLNAFPTQLERFKQIGISLYVQQMKLRGKYDALIGDATTNENLQLWKFGKNTGAVPSTSKSPESKKGFFQSFFGKE